MTDVRIPRSGISVLVILSQGNLSTLSSISDNELSMLDRLNLMPDESGLAKIFILLAIRYNFKDSYSKDLTWFCDMLKSANLTGHSESEVDQFLQRMKIFSNSTLRNSGMTRLLADYQSIRSAIDSQNLWE